MSELSELSGRRATQPARLTAREVGPISLNRLLERSSGIPSSMSRLALSTGCHQLWSARRVNDELWNDCIRAATMS